MIQDNNKKNFFLLWKEGNQNTPPEMKNRYYCSFLLFGGCILIGIILLLYSLFANVNIRIFGILCLFVSLFFLFDGVRTYYYAKTGKYYVLTGLCVNIKQNPWQLLKERKEIYFEAVHPITGEESSVFQLITNGKRNIFKIGGVYDIFIPQNNGLVTPFNTNGITIINTHLLYRIKSINEFE